MALVVLNRPVLPITEEIEQVGGGWGKIKSFVYLVVTVGWNAASIIHESYSAMKIFRPDSHGGHLKCLPN